MNNSAFHTQGAGFSQNILQRFSRRAACYDRQALLQRAIAWRLAHWVQRLELPPGPCADLGAGTGLLGQALQEQPAHSIVSAEALLQLDFCPELLAHNPLPRQHTWNLESGLPPELEGAALLTSSFALQWLSEPAGRLKYWCTALRPAGWLVLAVPTAASFPQWRQAAARAGVPCTALALPSASELINASAPLLSLLQVKRLHFHRRYGDGLHFLSQLSRLGAGASPSGPLRPGELRKLLAAWPTDGVVSWEVLMLVGQRRGASPACSAHVSNP
jgi:malonyl-CoA O-methyltransferase